MYGAPAWPGRPHMKIMLPLEKMFHCDSAQSKQISKKNSDIKAAWQKGKHQHLHRTLFDASLFFGTHVAGIIPFHWNSDKNSMKTWLTTWEVLIYFSRCTIVRNCAQSQLYAIVQLCNCADTEQKDSVRFTLQSIVSPRKSCPKEAPSPCWWLVMNSIIHYNVSPSREGLSWSALKKSIKRGGTPPTAPHPKGPSSDLIFIRATMLYHQSSNMLMLQLLFTIAILINILIPTCSS